MDDNISMRAEGNRGYSLNVPNALTVLRLILVPVLVVLMCAHDWNTHWYALIVFVAASITDHLDGLIARAYHLITDFGRLMDPIADKALTLSAFIMLSLNSILPWYFTIIVMVREIGVTILRAFLLHRGIIVSANKGGKLKTVLQMLLIFVLLIPWPRSDAGWIETGTVLIIVLAILTLLVTIWTGLVYVIEAWYVCHGKKKPQVGDSQT